MNAQAADIRVTEVVIPEKEDSKTALSTSQKDMLSVKQDIHSTYKLQAQSIQELVNSTSAASCSC